MASSNIALSMTGADKTAAMFASVQQRAKGAMGQLRKTLAFAGVGLGFAGVVRAAKQAVDSLGLLSDQAQRMSSSAEDVQRLTGALDKVGVVGVSVDSLAMAFGRMAKETGKVGVRGFREVLASVAALGTEQERVAELTRIMGREMGPKLAPLVRQGPEALMQGLDGVMAMMPAVSNAAVEVGDSASDALKVASNSIKVGWQQMIGDMVAGWSGTFGVSFEEGIYTAVEYVLWFVRSGWAHFKAFAENLGKATWGFVEDFRGGMEWIGTGFAGVLVGLGRLAREFGSQLWDWLTGEGTMDWKAVWQSAVDGFESVGKSAWGQGIEWSVVDDAAMAKARDTAIAVKRAGIDAQAKLATGTVAADESISTAASKGAAKIKQAAQEANKLVFAGTYDALKVRMRNQGVAVPAFGGSGGSARGSAGGASGSASGGDSQVARLLRELIAIERQTLGVVTKLGAV